MKLLPATSSAYDWVYPGPSRRFSKCTKDAPKVKAPGYHHEWLSSATSGTEIPQPARNVMDTLLLCPQQSMKILESCDSHVLLEIVLYDRWHGLMDLLCAQPHIRCDSCCSQAQGDAFFLWTSLDSPPSQREETSIEVHRSLSEIPSELQDRSKPIYYEVDVPMSLSQWRKKCLGQRRNSWKVPIFCARIKACNMLFHFSCCREQIEVLLMPKSILDIESHDSESIALAYNWPRLNGGRDIAIWKENQGSSKSWRVCITVKHNSKAFDISSLKAKHGNVVCPWVQASASAPVAYLKARKNFRQYQRLKQDSPQQERKTGRRHRCSVIRFQISEELSSEETKITHCSHSHKALGSWHSVLEKTKSDPMTPIGSSKIIIPSENFIGTVLGGQFQLGRLVRYEKFADVYEITPLLVATESRMEALAYDMTNHPRASKRDINYRAPFVLCQIDQSGKKYLVYHINERKQHEMGRRATKNKNRREKQRNAGEDEDVWGQTLSPTEKQIFPAEKKEKTPSVYSLNRNREPKKKKGTVKISLG